MLIFESRYVYWVDCLAGVKALLFCLKPACLDYSSLSDFHVNEMLNFQLGISASANSTKHNASSYKVAKNSIMFKSDTYTTICSFRCLATFLSKKNSDLTCMFLNPNNKSYLMKQRQDYQKTCSWRFSLHKSVHLNIFWTLFKKIALPRSEQLEVVYL